MAFAYGHVGNDVLVVLVPERSLSLADDHVGLVHAAQRFAVQPDGRVVSAVLLHIANEIKFKEIRYVRQR